MRVLFACLGVHQCIYQKNWYRP